MSRVASRAAALLLPLGLLATACARQSAPPGGEPDRRPPVVVAVSPDTFAVVEPGDRPIVIRFDERISERVGAGTLDDAVSVSPSVGPVTVEHGREGLEARIVGGLLPNTVYRVTVLPVVRDMFGNQMRAPFEWVFSTGPDFVPTVVGGLVWDRVTGDPVADVRVELRAGAPEDSLPAHVAVSDTAGLFALRYVPPGTYRVTAFEDVNQNRTAQFFEAQDLGIASVTLAGPDTVLTQFPVLAPDTTPPTPLRVEIVDSLTLRVQVDDPLDPTTDLSRSVQGVVPEDGSPLSMARILHEHEWRVYQDTLAAQRDSVAAARAAARADSLAAADTAVAAADSAGAPIDTAQAAPAAPQRPAGPPAGAPGGRGRGEREFLPDGRRIPATSFVIRLFDPPVPGVEYTLPVQGLVNLFGLVSEPRDLTFTRPVPAVADTTAPDTAGATPPDTSGVAPPDTGAVAVRRPVAQASGDAGWRIGDLLRVLSRRP